MMKRLLWCLLAVTVTLPVSGDTAMPEVLSGKEFQDVLARSGSVYISGQPSEAGLATLRKAGVGTVVNLRTPEEMAGKGGPEFDEAAVVEDLGMNYVSLPAGGEDHPYSPATLAQFAAVVESAKDGVLLHCKSAGRASHLWVAYLVKYRGLSMEDALAQGRAINFGQLPLEGFMGEGFRYSYDAVP